MSTFISKHDFFKKAESIKIAIVLIKKTLKIW